MRNSDLAEKMPDLYSRVIRQIVRHALNEDFGPHGDVTAISTIPARLYCKGSLVARENGVFCGIHLIREVYRQIHPQVKITSHVKEGSNIRKGQKLVTIYGPARALLSGERTALNFVQRLSGIATLTRIFVDITRKASAHPPKILDTRKTTPGLRLLEKYAVVCGEGINHRMGLFDMVLIKDNHLAALSQHQNPIGVAVQKARRRYPHIKVEVECDTLKQVRCAVEAKADIILLDNMTPARIRKALQINQGICLTEASGGITIKNLSKIARTGVDFISIGALTHSARSLDFALDFEIEK